MSDTPKLDFEERQRAQQVYEECCENPEDFAYNFVALQGELAVAQQRIAELEPDAERYQYSREHINYGPSDDGMCWATWDWCVGVSSLAPASLDAAIDAARAKEKK